MITTGFCAGTALQTLLFEEDHPTCLIKTDGFVGAGGCAIREVTLPAQDDLDISLSQVFCHPQASQLGAALTLVKERASQGAGLAVATQTGVNKDLHIRCLFVAPGIYSGCCARAPGGPAWLAGRHLGRVLPPVEQFLYGLA